MHLTKSTITNSNQANISDETEESKKKILKNWVEELRIRNGNAKKDKRLDVSRISS